MVTRTICCAAVGALTLILASCSSGRIEHPWLNPRPAEVLNERWQALPAARFREVTSENRGEAVRMLEAEAGQRLPGRDVHRFVPADFSGQPSGRFYLLRAVRTSGPDGSYQILVRGRAVTVRYAATAGGSATVQSAIVADLEQAPEQVYVELNVTR